MSLRDAISEVVGPLEELSQQLIQEEIPMNVAGMLLKGLAFSLKLSLKATEGELPSIPKELLVPAELQHRSRIDQEREKLRRERGGEDSSGEEGQKVVSVFGGPAAGEDGIPTVVTIPENIPLLSKTIIAGGVYQLREDGLHFLPEGKV